MHSRVCRAGYTLERPNVRPYPITHSPAMVLNLIRHGVSTNSSLQEASRTAHTATKRIQNSSHADVILTTC